MSNPLPFPVLSPKIMRSPIMLMVFHGHKKRWGRFGGVSTCLPKPVLCHVTGGAGVWIFKVDVISLLLKSVCQKVSC